MMQSVLRSQMYAAESNLASSLGVKTAHPEGCLWVKQRGFNSPDASARQPCIWHESVLLLATGSIRCTCAYSLHGRLLSVWHLAANEHVEMHLSSLTLNEAEILTK